MEGERGRRGGGSGILLPRQLALCTHTEKCEFLSVQGGTRAWGLTPPLAPTPCPEESKKRARQINVGCLFCTHGCLVFATDEVGGHFYLSRPCISSLLLLLVVLVVRASSTVLVVYFRLAQTVLAREFPACYYCCCVLPRCPEFFRHHLVRTNLCFSGWS